MAVTKVKNDGVDFSEASSIAFDTTTLFVDATNNRVGVGTITPSVELSIAGSDPQLVLWEGTDGASSSKVQLGTGTVQGFINLHKGDGTRTVQINSSGDTYFNGGNLGIGTTSPSYELDIQGVGNSRVKIKNTSVTGESQIHHDGNGDLNIKNTSNRHLRLFTNNTEYMRIDSTGNVGIGTSSPIASLHVNGDVDSIRVTNTRAGTQGAQLDLLHYSPSPADGDNMTEINMGGYYSGTSQAYLGAIKLNALDISARKGRMDFYTRSEDVFNPELSIETNGTTNSYLKAQGTNQVRLVLGSTGYYGDNTSNWIRGNSAYLQYNSASSGHTWEIGGNERMRIDSSGNVGIGTTSPGRLLNVGGASSGDIVGIKGSNYNQVNIAHSTNSSWGLLLGNSDSTLNTGYHHSISGNNLSCAIVNVQNDALWFGTNNAARAYFGHSGGFRVTESLWDGQFDTTNTGMYGSAMYATGVFQGQINYNSYGAEIININNVSGSGHICSLLQYRTLNSTEGSIIGNSTGLSFNNVSDYRKKDNIEDATGCLDRVVALRPRTYTHRPEYDSDTTTVRTGFIAHEVAEHIPSAVIGEKDAVDEDGNAVLQSLSASSHEMIANLVGAIKELKAENDALKTRIETLENA